MATTENGLHALRSGLVRRTAWPAKPLKIESGVECGPVLDRIIHIGLGKTATTSLQKSVFPSFAMHIGVPYLSCQASPQVKRLLAELRARHRTDVRPSDLPDTYFLSCEALVSWDPHWWEANSAALADAVGPDAHILVTVRRPRSWLTSVYLQRSLHEGNVLRPDEFFLPPKAYGPFLSTPTFDVESFSYAGLVDAYQKRFSRVTVVPLERMADLDFLARLGDATGFNLQAARASFEASRSNRAYSRRAVAWTFGLDRMLSALGLALDGSQRRGSLRTIDAMKSVASANGVPSEAPLDRKGVDRIVRGVGRRVAREFRWRRLMQRRLDAWFPYERYELDFDSLPWIPIERLEPEYERLFLS